MSSLHGEESNCRELTIGTTTEYPETPPGYYDWNSEEDRCLDKFNFGPTTPPDTGMYQPTSPLDLSEHDDVKRSVNMDTTIEWDGQQRPNLGACGTSACQSQSANQPHMSEESPSAFEEYGQGLDPIHRSAYPPTPTNPNLTSFRPHSRATGGTASSAHERSLILYTGPRGGSIDGATSFEEAASERGPRKRGRREGSDEDNDELHSKFRKMSLKGVSRYSRKRG